MIASHDFPDQRDLNRQLRAWRDEAANGVAPQRPKAIIRFLRNVTTESIDPYLLYHCGHREIELAVSHGDFDAIEAEIYSEIPIDGEADLRVFATVFSLDLLRSGEPDDGLNADAALSYLCGLWSKILETPSLLLAIHTMLPAWNSLGDADLELKKLNDGIRDFAASQPRIILVDFERIVRKLGWGNAVEPRFWYLYKSPFQEAFLNAWSISLSSEISRRLGKVKKVLLLDCDNTLWGGVVGEDGVEGILLDPNSFPGNTFVDFQDQVLELHRRGVLIGLISKNNESDVFEVFENHPAMRLRLDQLVGYRINWKGKAENIRELAEELNLSLDSIVFIDDSPQECEQVRQFLPMVDVIQLPQDHWKITALLKDYTGFPPGPASSEDLRRTTMYLEESQRKRSVANFPDFDSYLQSLDLRVEVKEAASDDRERIAQLTQRTNQFNLATTRYQDHEIQSLIESPDTLVLILRVKDRFGDYGKVGVAILERDHTEATIRDFLLSCRVLGRRVEGAFLDSAIRCAIEAWGVEELRSIHVPSRKNEQTLEFYDSQGWTLDGVDSEGRRFYRLSVKNLVENSGFVGTVSIT